jgi:hypothetical protein
MKKYIEYMNKEKVNESDFDKFKYKDIDPHGEEDWDEYELSSGDKLYFFVINKDGTVECGIGKAILQGDKLSLNVDIVINEKNYPGYEYPTQIKLNDDIKNSISRHNTYLNRFNLSNDKYIISIVNDFKFYDKFGAIQKTIRTHLLNNIKNERNEIQRLENDMEGIEQRTIELKNKLKSIDQYPDPQYINLNEDQFIVMKSRKDHGDDIRIDIKITTVKERTNNEGEKGYNLVDEAGNKVTYIRTNIEKLKERGYLLLKNKKNEDNKTYICNDVDLYKQFIGRMVKDVNKLIEKEIIDNREKVDSTLEKVNEKITELRKKRDNYRDLKIMDLVEQIKEYETN